MELELDISLMQEKLKPAMIGLVLFIALYEEARRLHRDDQGRQPLLDTEYILGGLLTVSDPHHRPS